MVPHQKIKSQYNIKSLNMQRSHLPFPPSLFFCLYIYPLRMAVEKRTSYFWWLGVDDDKGQVRSSGEGRGKESSFFNFTKFILFSVYDSA